MPSFELNPMMLREIIIDHYNAPRHKKKPENAENYAQTHSESVNCIDNIDVFLKMKDGKVEDALWEGTACAISTASTDILCDLLIGRTPEDADVIMANYFNMIAEKEYDPEVLDEAVAFMNTYRQPARIHCATIGWEAFKELLHHEEGHE